MRERAPALLPDTATAAIQFVAASAISLYIVYGPLGYPLRPEQYALSLSWAIGYVKMMVVQTATVGLVFLPVYSAVGIAMKLIDAVVVRLSARYYGDNT